jgi:hypothetical protein
MSLSKKCYKYQGSNDSWTELPGKLFKATSSTGYDFHPSRGLVISGGGDENNNLLMDVLQVDDNAVVTLLPNFTAGRE